MLKFHTVMSSLAQCFILGLLAKISLTAEFDNGLIGTPEIQCNTDTIEMAFRTKKRFTGKVFVKGHYNNPECRVDYSRTDTDGQPIGGIKLNHGQCDMDRQRMIRPEGMQFSTVLVISFHPLFITKTDRAFHIKCLYREATTTVSSNFEVSVLPTESLTYDFPLPTCTYTIRKDEIDGPILTYARVGDQVVHRWECLSDIYGLLVHSCYVEDGQGEKELIIDDKGCHTDRTLLGDPTYVEALNMAYRESLVFKFADRVVVRFQCEIRLCVKEGRGCSGITPPICSGSDLTYLNRVARRKWTTDTSYDNDEEEGQYRRREIRRAANVTQPTIDTDLISQSIYVLDTDDDSTGKPDLGFSLDKVKHNGKVCVEALTFTILVTVLMAMFVIASTTALYVLIKWYRNLIYKLGLTNAAGKFRDNYTYPCINTFNKNLNCQTFCTKLIYRVSYKLSDSSSPSSCGYTTSIFGSKF